MQLKHSNLKNYKTKFNCFHGSQQSWLVIAYKKIITWDITNCSKV